MSLIFSGTYSPFTQSGPAQWNESPWDMDTLIIPYRGAITDLDAFLASHPVGEASPIDVNMFLANKSTDNHKQFPTVQLQFTGKRNGAIPPARHEFSTDLGSASSKRAASGMVALNPFVADYSAPTSILTYYSKDAPGEITVDDPVGLAVVEKITQGDATFSVTGIFDNVISQFFTQSVVLTKRAIEVVPLGKWWQNISKKARILAPFVFTPPGPGPFLTCCSPGVGYHVGQNVNIQGASGIANITVTSVMVLWGDQDTEAGITGWTVNSNSMTENETCIPHGFTNQRLALWNNTMI